MKSLIVCFIITCAIVLLLFFQFISEFLRYVVSAIGLLR